jgi:hypothetical protein
VKIMTDSSPDDWIYLHLGYNLSYSHLITTLSIFYTLSVHRCKRTRIFVSSVTLYSLS